ncbi:PREDICTED: uncharacterized protein LOC100638265 [Amphimedon queenslandica]|uniref:Tyrosine specific protein phosphatases domain-containing protein n=1 Tax=Amphimedon queenslandica TaxID=400682 RepID=A0A1X7UIN7_AMPQE|nr:PREDICTED: uncharacterized protein LOC100638265 [Amphimedon queenslandica]|eukprot:XP_003387824.1 PREDICTED: uncharacterized protein LOC100638265 [Amphimedon queenslandica]
MDKFQLASSLFVAALLLKCCISEDYHPQRTLLIDYYPKSSSPTNFLFRGNMPVINNTFAYKEIMETMSEIVVKKNFTFPQNPLLVVVSYLNPFEYSDLKIEKDFFKDNPQNGSFYNRVIVGTPFPPPQNDTKLLKDIVKERVDLSVDQLPNLASFLHTQLKQQGPVVIYSHCEAGTDRTGEVSGAYYLTYLNMTFTEALAIDNHVQSRDMETVSRNGLQWYCFYLLFVKGYDKLECLV